MKQFFYELFGDSAEARGVLYILISVGGSLATAFQTWASEPPANWYEITAVCLGALVAGGATLRAYLDQHLSKGKNEPNNPNQEPGEPSKPGIGR